MFSLVTEQSKELEASHDFVMEELFAQSKEIDFEKWLEEKQQKEIEEKYGIKRYKTY